MFNHRISCYRSICRVFLFPVTGSWCTALQDKTLRYHVEMFESTPFIELAFQATVPVSCTGDDCPLTASLKRHVGLSVSSCLLTLSMDTYYTLRIRPVSTAGRNARIVPLRFDRVLYPGSPWHRFRLHRILVQNVQRNKIV